MNLNFYAHTPSKENPVWHLLTDHLADVGKLSASFAKSWGGDDLSHIAGLWHDIGKFQPEFQAYLRSCAEGRQHPTVPHAIWGAALAYCLLSKRRIWKTLALAIAGHHTGLPAGGEIEQIIQEFLEANPRATGELSTWVHQVPLPISKIHQPPQNWTPTQHEFFNRMVFSTLVDADYLDTEKHFHPSRQALRSSAPSLSSLQAPFWASQRELLDRAAAAPASQAVNDVRRRVYEACLAASNGARGFYRLTVPTGGGKTLSGLAFALKHAEHHEVSRIVVAVPYTSIVEQTVSVYRGIYRGTLGSSAVLEHHSQVDPSLDEHQSLASYTSKLATENWDHPLIVTTTVQLFESLLSNRPGKMRKLHRLAGSVILLDEVQALPPELLEPTLDVLRSLVSDYSATVVLSTATQPTFDAVPGFASTPIQGELVPDYADHFERLKRVSYEWREQALDWRTVADAVRREQQILVIVNTRRDALAILDLCGDIEGLFHLSTLLCGAHRSQALNDIRERLHRGEPVRLVSTQVVEAGVDLDFPTVWRAIGPLDRIVQAAGRCNREGKLASGRVVIFEPKDGGAPRGPYQIAIEEAKLIIHREGPEALHDSDVFFRYFQRVFGQVRLDAHGIQRLRRAMNYPAVAASYRLVPDDTVPIVVPYGDAMERLDAWRRDPTWTMWRRLSPYVVNVYRNDLRELGTWLEPVSDGLFCWTGRYDGQIKGLPLGIRDPADLII